MSAPAISDSVWIFFSTALGTALLGGWHCAGMCGPIAALAGQRRALVLYQWGRLISYVTLGLLAAFFGERILGWIPAEQKFWISLALGLLSMWVLLSSWRLRFPQRLQTFLWRHRPRGSLPTQSFYVGLLNGLLPCTWLYGYVMMAATLASPTRAVVLMFCLWLGSLPWLLGLSVLGTQLRWLSPKNIWIERVLLFAVFFSLFAHHWHPHH